jgi:hypothetical protein
MSGSSTDQGGGKRRGGTFTPVSDRLLTASAVHQ